MKLPNILKTGIAMIAFISSPFLVANADTSSFNNDQVKQIQQIVHDYLVNNPQVLVEASVALQKQEMAKATKSAQSAIIKNANQVFADPMSPVVGNAQGSITLVEFFDYQCPHCKEMAATVDDLIKKNSNLRVVLKELPIFGNSSLYAAKAALAAEKQGAGKYWKFHDALMAAENPLTNDKILKIAKSSGLNVDELKKAMDSDAVKKQIQDNFNLAQNLGIMGTPTFVVSKWQVGSNSNNVNKAAFVPGATSADNLEQLIKQAGG